MFGFFCFFVFFPDQNGLCSLPGTLAPEMKSWFISAFISCDVSPSLALSQVQAVHGAGVGGLLLPRAFLGWAVGPCSHYL